MGGFEVQGVAGEGWEIDTYKGELDFLASSVILLVYPGLFSFCFLPFPEEVTYPACSSGCSKHSTGLLCIFLESANTGRAPSYVSEAGLTLRGAERMKTKSISPELTSGGEETPVIMRCDKFSNVDVERVVGAGREELM